MTGERLARSGGLSSVLSTEYSVRSFVMGFARLGFHQFAQAAGCDAAGSNRSIEKRDEKRAINPVGIERFLEIVWGTSEVEQKETKATKGDMTLNRRKQR